MSMFLKDMTDCRLVLFVLILSGIAMVPPSVVLHYWQTSSGTVIEDLRLYSYKLPQEVHSGVAEKTDFLAPLHLSGTNLARTISSYVNDTDQISFPRIESEGTTSVALYGLGNIRDERLNRMFQTPHAVQWMRPETQQGCEVSDWFNILVLHQNRVKKSG